MNPVGAKELKAAFRFFPDFSITLFTSSGASGSLGRSYSPRKALRIDFAIVLSISLSSWKKMLSFVQSSTMYRASRLASGS